MSTKINIKNLKEVLGKLNFAIERTKINPKSDWIEIKSDEANNNLVFKVSNYDYYLESSIVTKCEEPIFATITSSTFIPLISKLDEDEVEMFERLNSLIVKTSQSEYTFPIIKEMGEVKTVDEIKLDKEESLDNAFELDGSFLESVADTNAKGLLDSSFSKDIQQFVYVDEKGALTWTENIYINTNKTGTEREFKALFNLTQAKILKVFGDCKSVGVYLEKGDNYTDSNKIRFVSNNDNYSLTCIFLIQSDELTEKFPCIRIRNLAESVEKTHAIIDKKALEKALSRLMVFDKKFDKTVLNYSQFEWGKDSVKLVSLKNKNYEVVPYESGVETVEHTSMIRFADIVAQLQATMSKSVDISYGDSPAITINSDNLKQLIPEIQYIG